MLFKYIILLGNSIMLKNLDNILEMLLILNSIKYFNSTYIELVNRMVFFKNH